MKTLKLIAENNSSSLKIIISLIIVIFLYKIISNTILKIKTTLNENLNKRTSPLNESLMTFSILATFYSVIGIATILSSILIKQNLNSYKPQMTLTIIILIMILLYKTISKVIIETSEISLNKNRPLLNQVIANMLIMLNFISILVISLGLTYLILKI